MTKKNIRCKWVFKRKVDGSNSEVFCYNTRLVAKGYSQVQGVGFNYVFSSVVKYISIRVLLSLVAMKDLELEQLDVKIVFLHGDLEDQIYIKQPKGFEITGKRTMCVC
jgi:Reverse transcriptase (RNA-dependent DNA polymerase)